MDAFTNGSGVAHWVGLESGVAHWVGHMTLFCAADLKSTVPRVALCSPAFQDVRKNKSSSGQCGASDLMPEAQTPTKCKMQE
eukprot:scaffold307242_cov18-Tisochrysis_lutea.AAC.1